MTLRVRFPQLAIRRARAMAEDIEKNVLNQRKRDQLSQEVYGLSHRYLRRVGVINRSPSNRVLVALGLELLVRDPATGEEEVIPLMQEEA